MVWVFFFHPKELDPKCIEGHIRLEKFYVRKLTFYLVYVQYPLYNKIKQSFSGLKMGEKVIKDRYSFYFL